MTEKVIALNIKAGIQRDGTLLAAPSFVDGLWSRFQRGLPRKMGGYIGVFQNASGVSRGMNMISSNGLNYVISGYNAGLEQWVTQNYIGLGTGPNQYTFGTDPLGNPGFVSSPNNLWQFDIGYDSGGGVNNLVAHPGQNLAAIDSEVNTRVLSGAYPGTSLSPVGVFSVPSLTLTNGSATVTLATADVRIGAGQTVTASIAGLPGGTTVKSIVNTTLTLSANFTGTTGSATLTFDNNIAVSGGVVILHPYLFVYGNHGLIQNCSAGNFENWVSSDANANNVATGKIVKGLPIRGGSTSPSGLFWALDSVIRVAYSPSTVNGLNFYWTYDLLTSQTSIMSSSCVIEYDGLFYWMGVDRFLMYNGVVQELPNNANQNWIFDNINYQQRQKVWVTKVPRYGEIWWFYPRGNATECTDAIIYNVREQTWYDAGQAMGAQRSAGVFSEVFTKPIWAGNVSNGYEVTAASQVSGGTGYAVNDLVRVLGGNGTPALLSVSAISGGVVTALNVVTQGSYTLQPSGTLSTVAVSGSGTGLTVTLTTAQKYTLWEHESGYDQVLLGQVTAIDSYIETNNIGWVTGGPGGSAPVGDNKQISLSRVEPDFVQVGPMNLFVTGRGYADDTDYTSAPYTFLPTTFKIDMKEQRREMRLRFESNTQGGTYQMGRVLLSVDFGDERGTGNPA